MSGTFSRISDAVFSASSKVQRTISAHEILLSKLLLVLFLFMGVLTRILPLRGESLTSPVFTTPEAYESLRKIRYTAENFPALLSTDLYYSVPSEYMFSDVGSIEFIIGFIGFLFGDSAIFVLLHLLPVLSYVLIGLLTFLIVSNLYRAEWGALSVAILTLLPGEFYTQTTAISGDISVFSLVVVIAFIYVLYTLIQEFDLNGITVDSTKKDLSRSLLVRTISILVLSSLIASMYASSVTIIVASLLTYLLLLSSFRSSTDQFIESKVFAVSLPLVALFVISSISYLLFGSSTVSISTYSLFQPVIALIGVIFAGTILANERGLLLGNENPVSEKGLMRGVAVILVAAILGLIHITINIIESLQLLFDPQSNSLASVGIETLITTEFGFLFFSAVIGFLFFFSGSISKLVSTDVISRSNTDLKLIVGSFGLIFGISYMFDVSYALQLAVFISVFSVYFVKSAIKYGDFEKLNRSNVKTYQILIIFMIMILFIPALVVPVEGAVFTQANQDSFNGTEAFAESVEVFEDENIHSDEIYQNPQEDPTSVAITLNEGTPVVSGLGEYPTTGPTEESTEFASRFLLSQSMDEAENVEEEYGTSVDYIVMDSSMASVEQSFGTQLSEAHPEYSRLQMSEPVFSHVDNNFVYSVHTDLYYDTLATRMYSYHGSNQQVQPVTVAYTESQVGESIRGSTYEFSELDASDHIRKFESVQQAQEFIDLHSGELERNIREENEDISDEEVDEILQETAAELDTTPSSEDLEMQLGGIGTAPTKEVEHIEDFRYINGSEQSKISEQFFQFKFNQIQRYMDDPTVGDFMIDDSRAKVFERVEGQEIQGSGAPENQEVIIRTTLENTDSTIAFAYVQSVEADENGEFSTTVPYSTQGTPEGYNIQPRQVDYEILSQEVSIQQDGEDLTQDTQIYRATTPVTEEQVTTDSDPIRIELEEISQEEEDELFGNSS